MKWLDEIFARSRVGGWRRWIEKQDGLWYIQYGGHHYFNRAMAREFHMTRRALPTSAFLRFCHPDDMECVLDHVERGMRQGQHEDIAQEPVRWHVLPGVYESFASLSRCVQKEPEEIYVGHAVKTESAVTVSLAELESTAWPSLIRPTLIATSMVALAAIVSYLISLPKLFTHVPSMFMLACLMTLKLTNTKAAALACSLGGFVWAICFVPPFFTIWLADWRDIVTLALFQMAGLVLYLTEKR
jgi:hypothetical protein